MKTTAKLAIATATLTAALGFTIAGASSNAKDCCKSADFEIKKNAETGAVVATATRDKSVHFEFK